MAGRFGPIGTWPFRILTSIWLTDAAATRISTMPGRIAGLGTSVSAKFSGPPNALRIWARITTLPGKDDNSGTSEAEAPIRLGVGD
jgi:hypothetical protein